MSSQAFRYDYAFDPEDPDSTAARICKLVGHGRHVLELGCAAGAMTAVLAHHYRCKVTGVELDAEAARAAAPHAEAIHVASLEDPAWVAPLAGRQFDTILAADVLEHLHNPAACLQQLRPLLNSDGRLIVSVPNVAHGGVIAGLFCGEFEYREVGLMDRTHVHFFTPAALRRMLEANGFNVEHETMVRTGSWHPEFAPYWQALPEALRSWLERGPVTSIYQSVMVSRIIAQPDPWTPPTPATLPAPEVADWLAEAPFRTGPDTKTHTELRAQVDGLQEQAQTLAALAQALQTQLDDVYTSLSWRITAPLRALARLLRGRG